MRACYLWAHSLRYSHIEIYIVRVWTVERLDRGIDRDSHQEPQDTNKDTVRYRRGTGEM